MNDLPNTPRRELPELYIEAAQCPTCHCPDYHVYATRAREHDGSRTRFVRCTNCGQKFKIIAELSTPLS